MNEILSYLVYTIIGFLSLSTNDLAAYSEENIIRYHSIAHDAMVAAYDPSLKPIFPGDSGRLKTAVLLLTIASFESEFSPLVDNGTKRGDNGRSWCLMQINIGEAAFTMRYADGSTESWYGKDLVTDRVKCFKAGIYMLRSSIYVCKDLPHDQRLSAYICGSCEKDIGKELSIGRYHRYKKWIRKNPPPASADRIAAKYELPQYNAYHKQLSIDVVPELKLD